MRQRPERVAAGMPARRKQAVRGWRHWGVIGEQIGRHGPACGESALRFTAVEDDHEAMAAGLTSNLSAFAMAG
jgi:hypothetical protein